MFGQATSLESYISLYVLSLLKVSYLILCHGLTHHSVLVVNIIMVFQLPPPPPQKPLVASPIFFPISFVLKFGELHFWMRLKLF